MFSIFNKLTNIVTAIWLVISFPAILRLMLELASHGWQDWKQVFRGKRNK